MTGLLIENLAEIATPLGTTPRRGAEQAAVARLRAGSAGSDASDASGIEILCRDGRLVFVGARAERERLWGELPGVARLDGRRGTAVPGFVDGHTHLPWAGSREDEFVQRLAGTVLPGDRRRRRRHPFDGARDARGGGSGPARARPRAARLDALLRHHDRRGEERLRAQPGRRIEAAREPSAPPPPRSRSSSYRLSSPRTKCRQEYRHRRGAYLDLVCEEIVPAAAEHGLARFCDVFCEKGVFSAAESRRVLEAGRTSRASAPLARRRVRRLRRRPSRRRARSLLRRSSDGGLAGRNRRPGGRRRDRAAAAGHELLPRQADLRPGAPPDRRRRTGRARHRLQSRLLVHRIAADHRAARGLRARPVDRRGPHRRHPQFGLQPRARRARSARSKPASAPTSFCSRPQTSSILPIITVSTRSAA